MIKKRRGFTLIEVLVVIALISIFMGIISIFVINSSRFASDSKKNFNSQSEARIAMSYITMKIREFDQEKLLTIKDNKLDIKDKYSIYFKDGKLVEYSVGESKEVPIAQLDSFLIERVKEEEGNPGKEILIKVGFLNKEKKEVYLEESLTVRSSLREE